MTKDYKTYHSHDKRVHVDKFSRLKNLLCVLINSKQQVELALFKAKISLEELNKLLNIVKKSH